MNPSRRAPSIKSLLSAFLDITREDAVLIRNIIKATKRSELEALAPELYRKIDNTLWYKHEFSELKLLMINDIIGTHGVEYIPRGKNRKSPAITYCNAGVTYAATILFVNGRYLIGDWGSIVERGNYE